MKLPDKNKHSPEMIKEGYKNTDIGVIPEDWEVITYEDAFDFLKSATYSRAELFIDGEIGYVHYGDIHTKYTSYYLDMNTAILPFISNTQLKSYHFIEEGDVIVVDASEDYEGVGKSVEVKNLKNRKVISGLHTYLLRNKNNTIVNGYKGLIFYNTLVKKQIDTLATGMKIYSISKNNLKDIKIPIPKYKAEQTAIATALSDIDALMDATEKLIAKKKAIKQGAMQKLLEPKEGWVEKTLEDCTNCLDNLRIPLNEVQRTNMSGDYPYCGANGILDYINDWRIDDNVILIAEDGGYFDEYATRPIAYRMNGKFWVNNHAHILKSKIEFDQDFIFYSLVHKNILNFLSSGTRAKLNKAEMYKITVSLPKNKTEQSRIAQILSDMDNEIALLEQKLEKQKQLKQGMMQNLLTGKIRLVGKAESKEVEKKEVKVKKQKHNEQINEAVVLSFLVHKFGTDAYPLSRFRYTKYAYLLHRQYEKEARGFDKYAAGPYKPENRYKGAEGIALKNKYILKVSNPKSQKDAFVSNENIIQALNYFNDWYGENIQTWIEQFRYYKNDYLEVLTTVDKAKCDLIEKSISVNVDTIKACIASVPQWKSKLGKPYFSDIEIQKAIDESNQLFESN